MLKLFKQQKYLMFRSSEGVSHFWRTRYIRTALEVCDHRKCGYRRSDDALRSGQCCVLIAAVFVRWSSLDAARVCHHALLDVIDRCSDYCMRPFLSASATFH